MIAIFPSNAFCCHHGWRLGCAIRIRLTAIAMRICVMTPILLCDVVCAQACWDAAASRYDVSRDVLRSISYVESRFTQATGKPNRNGTYDVCHMQVNSGHFAYLHTRGITEQTLLNNPCVCTEVGAWVLANCKKQFGNTWEAVGCYNAGSAPGRRELRLRYARLVRDAYDKLKAGQQ